MPYSIMIDAGHGGNDPGAVYKGRREKDDNLALAMEVGRILSENGVDVLYTRTTDDYISPFERARLANEAKVDFFISFHRNSSPEVNQYIVGALGELGFREIGVQARPGLVVLRKTKMPALLIETGFLNSDKDNQLYDEKNAEIAQAIAGAILGTLDQQQGEEPLYYRVQTGAFRKRENADRMLYLLQEKGYPAYILQDGELYKVQVGAFLQLDNAIRMEQKLREDGYCTLIVTK